MTKNQLPEGVGKKIVEALKRQSEIEINPVADEELQDTPIAADNNLEFFENVITQEVNDNIIASDIKPQDNFIIEEANIESDTQQFNFSYESTPQVQTRINENLILDNTMDYHIPEETKMTNTKLENKAVDVPANVAVLKRLISQLPAGVTKQTGAQIIRQTIEALGISMNSVLQEAQQVQDSLNGSIKDCMSKVQEYKNNIMHLERHAQDYQRQVSQINDLISLFILTDKTK